jgi:DNA-binding NarL/FixJ family response regulator
VRFTQYVSRMRRCAMTVVLDEPGDRLLRMRRHRFIVYRWVWELPGGYVDDGEDSLAAAARGVEEDLLDAEDDICVTGLAGDGFGAVALAREQHPDVILMDIRMPGLDGIAATREIARDPALAGVRVLILTTFGLDEYIFDALRAGAAGFLVKDTDAAELIRAVRVIAAGEGLLSPGVTRRLIAEFAARARSPQPAPLLDELTAREREVVGLVAAGLSNDDIAQRLYVSQSTVKTHVARAMLKLAARDRAQLVVAAYESGLARPGWSGAP